MIFKIFKNKRKTKSEDENKKKTKKDDIEKFILDTTDYCTLNKVLPATGIKEK